MVLRLLLLLCLLNSPEFVRAEEDDSLSPLTFDRQSINRYSLDHLPRSLSVRQGTDVWLGFDLERGKLYKAWKAPENEEGLLTKGFTTQSHGASWYEDKTDAGWSYSLQARLSPLAIRYLGCSDRQEHFELRWELRYAERRLVLTEMIPKRTRPQTRVEREIQVDRLEPGEAIVPPEVAGNPWRLLDENGQETTGLFGPQRYRWVLP
jgi:hypothetical protein